MGTSLQARGEQWVSASVALRLFFFFFQDKQVSLNLEIAVSASGLAKSPWICLSSYP